MASKREEYAIWFAVVGMVIGLPIGWVLGNVIFPDIATTNYSADYSGLRVGLAVFGMAIFLLVFAPIGWVIGTRKEKELEPIETTSKVETGMQNSSESKKLAELKKMFNDGVITEEEFTKKKKEILDKF
jgi:uncharacterized membrane protein